MWRCTDDCIIYRPIRNNDDTILLQNDLNKVAEWEFMWQMQFNIDKCFILRVGRPKHKLLHLYTLHNQHLSETDSAKYLGVTITSDLQWNKHINNITNKANSILGLLRRNLRIPSQTIIKQYQSLVRPHLEYASTVWDPHTHKIVTSSISSNAEQPDTPVIAGITSAASLRWSATWAGSRSPHGDVTCAYV